MRLSSLLIAFVVIVAAYGPVLAAEHPGYRVLVQDKGHIIILSQKGEVEWEVPCNYTSHDLARLPNGNFLLNTGPATVVEMTPEKKIVWQYEAKPKEGYKGRVEIHACQRLADGSTLVSESGNARIVEVDKDGKLVKQMPLKVDHPSSHSDTRLVR